MTYGSIAKDFLKKVVLPVFLAWLLFAMFKPVFTKDGVTDYYMVWLVCGIPFGIWRLRLWLISRNFDIGGTVGVQPYHWRSDWRGRYCMAAFGGRMVCDFDDIQAHYLQQRK